jgi:hypothetical protein
MDRKQASTSQEDPATQAWANVAVAEFAAAVIATWQAIDQELSPVIGRRGVVALYQHSVERTVPAGHPMRALVRGVHAGIDFVALEGALLAQDHAEALSDSRRILQRFYDTLAGLIGTTLTQRLLRTLWTDSADIAPAQEDTP